MSARLFFAALLAAFAVAGSALGAPPFDEEFQVNTYTSSFQTDPAIAVDANGGFVVVWGSYGSAGSDDDLQSIQGQRYVADGSVIELQFQVNTYTTGAQSQPSLAVEADGSFVVVWSSDGSNGDDDAYQSIQGQRYDATGSPVGGEFQVNTYTTDAQREPAVAAHADGAFVVVWSSNGSAGSDKAGYSIQGQRYDASGGSLGGEFEVNTFTFSEQRRPSAAIDADGDFLIVWQSLGSSEGDVDGFSIQAQRYQSGGNAVGDQFQVNTYTTSTQAGATLGIDTDGDFVVVWESFGSDDDSETFSIQGQRYASDGGAQGAQFQVNTTTLSEQRRPAVGVAPDGSFVVAWDSIGSTGDDTSAYSLQSQRYDDLGNAVGGEFQVNTTTTANQAFSAVAAIEDGVFDVVWRSDGSGCDDSESASIQGQLFGASASAPGITLNAPCLLSTLDIIADSDDVFPSSVETLFPTGRNFNDSHQVTEEASLSDASYDFSPGVLEIRFDHARGTTGFAQAGFDTIFFTVGEDDFYTLEGVYTAVDSEGGNIAQAMELIDVTDAVSLFAGGQQSENTPNESFTLGRQGGDSMNDLLEGELTGTLVAGHVYRLEYSAFIQADSETTLSATASGFFRLSLGATVPTVPVVPALGPTSLMLLAALLAAAAIHLLRPQEARTTR